MSHYYSRTVTIPFDQAIDNITRSLQRQGFGVITTIDVKEILKQKLNIDFDKYKIIGACNPEFAFEVITIEPHAGLMLPCNLVVHEYQNGDVEISAINPLDSIGRTTAANQLTSIATETGNRLRTAIDDACENTKQALHSIRMGINEKKNATA